MRICSKCQTEKENSEFHKQTNDPHGLQSYCKMCMKSIKYSNHKKGHQKDYRKYLVRAAKCRAKQKNIPFDITWKDLELLTICPVFGVDMFSDTRNNPFSPSIDRLIPELGYVKGNVRVISRRANVIKSDASIREIEEILDYMKREIAFNKNVGYSLEDIYDKVESDYHQP